MPLEIGRFAGSRNSPGKEQSAQGVGVDLPIEQFAGLAVGVGSDNGQRRHISGWCC